MLPMVQVFGVEDWCAEPFGSGDDGGIVVVHLKPAGEDDRRSYERAVGLGHARDLAGFLVTPT